MIIMKLIITSQKNSDLSKNNISCDMGKGRIHGLGGKGEGLSKQNCSLYRKMQPIAPGSSFSVFDCTKNLFETIELMGTAR